MSEIRYRTMSQALIEAFPELQASYEDEVQAWEGEDPGAHNVCSALLVPWIASLAAEPGKNQETLERIFGFLERAIDGTDEDVANVVSVTVLEELLGLHSDVLPQVRPFMGTKTAETLHIIDTWTDELYE